ncbi:MAG: hypothetical protein K9H26_11790 [Prolixibacteraceae bacterium]|nr:hypothetical protein [Prolixibacteraceae bacterium]
MKWLLLIGLFALPVLLKCQPVTSENKYFKGYVLSADSMPVESAYLVSYLSLKAYTTNAKGYYSIPAEPSDSFAIVHISYARKIVVANTLAADSNTIILDFSPYEIRMVDIKFRDLEMEYFEKNMAQIKSELSKELYLSRNHDFIHNAYAPQPPPAGYVRIAPLEIIDRLIQNIERLKKQFDD